MTFSVMVHLRPPCPLTVSARLGAISELYARRGPHSYPDFPTGTRARGVGENFGRPRHYFATMPEMERSHAELRAAVILAGRKIKKLNFGRRDSPVLARLRLILREARRVAKENASGQGTQVPGTGLHAVFSRR